MKHLRRMWRRVRFIYRMMRAKSLEDRAKIIVDMFEIPPQILGAVLFDSSQPVDHEKMSALVETMHPRPSISDVKDHEPYPYCCPEHYPLFGPIQHKGR